MLKDENLVEEIHLADCADKLAFDTKTQAEASAVVAKYQHGTNLKVYLCQKCGLWHLSSA
jgi:hypothetical protein